MDQEEILDTKAFRSLLLEKVDHLHECIEKFKTQASETITRITILETQVGILLKVSWLLFGTIVVGLLGASLKLLIR